VAFSTLLRRPGLRASSDGVLATKSVRKKLASTCLYSLYAWYYLIKVCTIYFGRDLLLVFNFVLFGSQKFASCENISHTDVCITMSERNVAVHSQEGEKCPVDSHDLWPLVYRGPVGSKQNSDPGPTLS